MGAEISVCLLLPDELLPLVASLSKAVASHLPRFLPAERRCMLGCVRLAWEVGGSKVGCGRLAWEAGSVRWKVGENMAECLLVLPQAQMQGTEGSGNGNSL